MESTFFPQICDVYRGLFSRKILTFSDCYRYIEDNLVLIPSKTEFSGFLSLANSTDSCIQFIFEVENGKFV